VPSVLAIVVPFLNEERHLPAFLASMAAQTRPPDRLVLVDDGSADGSLALAAEFARTYSWASVLQRPPRPPARDRLAEAHELRAFGWAVERLEPSWEVVAKMDADLDLSPATIETIEAAFVSNPRLGLAGAQLCELAPDGSPVPLGSPRDHVEGATKFYRRACWDDIAPIPAILGWDTLDEFHARLHGWETESLEIPGRAPVHLRRMGTQQSILRSFRRWGACAYGYGAHPLYVAFYGARLMRRRRPRLIGGMNYFLGWALAVIRRAPRADPQLRKAVQEAQVSKARRRLTRARRDRSVRPVRTR
jgi:poly-beta-1,6-N-acetyl-D-glucosamine synthase